MNTKQIWHWLTTSRYTRLLEKQNDELRSELKAAQERLRQLEQKVAPRLYPTQINTEETTDTVVPTPRSFRVRKPWRMEKAELEKKHNQLEEKGKRLADNLAQLPPALHQ
jgi:hypothetical protein